jgi:hypothetical protein
LRISKYVWTKALVIDSILRIETSNN